MYKNIEELKLFNKIHCIYSLFTIPELTGSMWGFIPSIKSRYTFKGDRDSLFIMYKKAKAGIITFNENRFTARMDCSMDGIKFRVPFTKLHVKMDDVTITEKFKGHFSTPLYGELLTYHYYSDYSYKYHHDDYVRVQSINEVYVISQSHCAKRDRLKTSNWFSESFEHSFGQMSKDDLEFVSKLPQLPQLIKENMNILLIKQ